MSNSWTDEAEASLLQLKAAALRANLRKSGLSITIAEARRLVREHPSLNEAQQARIDRARRSIFGFLTTYRKGPS